MDANQLKELRRQLSLTQAEMAVKLGVTRDAIAKYEAGMTISKPVQMLAEQLIRAQAGNGQ